MTEKVYTKISPRIDPKIRLENDLTISQKISVLAGKSFSWTVRVGRLSVREALKSNLEFSTRNFLNFYFLYFSLFYFFRSGSKKTISIFLKNLEFRFFQFCSGHPIIFCGRWTRWRIW